jgi:RNA polymerase-binding transcription factor DksA
VYLGSSLQYQLPIFQIGFEGINVDLVNADPRGYGLPGLFCFECKRMRDTSTILSNELDQLRVQIAALESNLENKPDYGLGEGASSVTRWELDLALLHELKERVASLERASSPNVDDEYGKCKQCGAAIHPDRLAVLPGVETCVRCARADEQE